MLGLTQSTTSRGWYTGVEIVGTVLPSNFGSSVILKREVLAGNRFNDMALIEVIAPHDDTSEPPFRDDIVSSGKVYDLDGPGIGVDSGPNGTIFRLRVNFREYATVDGDQVSSDLSWYSRVSVVKTSRGDQVLVQTGIANDNEAGTGSTKLTWNLQ